MRAKHASKPGPVGLRNAERDLLRAEKKLVAHAAWTHGFEDDLAAARKSLELRLAKADALHADIAKLRLVRDAAALDTVHSPPDPLGPDAVSSAGLRQLLEAAAAALPCLSSSADPGALEFGKICLQSSTNKRRPNKQQQWESSWPVSRRLIAQEW